MYRRSVQCMGLGALLLASGCASKVPYDPFRVSRDQFYPTLKVVALAPMSVPSDLEDPDPARRNFATLIESQLQDAGLVIISPNEFELVWDSISNETGGFFDPVTGEVDQTKVRTVRTHVYRDLRAKHNIDAVLFTAIIVVPAKLDSDQASWDGTSQGAGKGKFWKALLGVSHSGTIPALSLQVVLSDTADNDLYVNAGGIELLGRMSVNGMTRVRREELFLNQERLVKAVRLALDPLLGRTANKNEQDVGAPPTLTSLQAAPAHSLATSYRDVAWHLEVLRLAEDGGTVVLASRPVTQANVQTVKAELERQRSELAAVISERGFARVAGRYRGETDACKAPSLLVQGIRSGADSFAIVQDSFVVELTQHFGDRPMAITAIVVDSAIAFNDPGNSDFPFVGEIKREAIVIHPETDRVLGAWPRHLEEPPSRRDLTACVVRLMPQR